MLQRRSTWFAFLAGFNLILVIWHITVQEPTIGAQQQQQQQQQQQTASGPLLGDYYGDRGDGPPLNGFNRKQPRLPGLGGGVVGGGGSDDGEGGGGMRGGLVPGGGIGINGNAIEGQLYAGKHLLSDMALGNESAMMGESTSAASGIGGSQSQQPQQQPQQQQPHPQQPHSQQQQSQPPHQQPQQQQQQQPPQEAQQQPMPSQPQPQPQPHSSRAADTSAEEEYGFGAATRATAVSHRQSGSHEDTDNHTNNTSTQPLDTAPPAGLPRDDFARLMDLRDFSFQLDQPPCDRNVRALILVHSAPSNFHKRSIIRETWGNRDYMRQAATVRLIFLLGTLAGDPDRRAADHLQARLEAENARHADLVQGTFVDNYRNMTYKHVMAFKWLLYRCPGAQLLIKLDDDVFLNMPVLQRYLGRGGVSGDSALPPGVNSCELPRGNGHKNDDEDDEAMPLKDAEKERRMAACLGQPPEGLLLCHKHVGSYVKRSYRSKWRVGYKEYAGRTYPPYCPGFAIFYSRHVARRLYAAAQQHAYFWIDDVLITGVLAQEQNITITNVSPYMWHKVSERDPGRLVKPGELAPQFLISGHALTDRHIRALWALVRDGEGGGESMKDSGRTANTLGR